MISGSLMLRRSSRARVISGRMAHIVLVLFRGQAFSLSRRCSAWTWLPHPDRFAVCPSPGRGGEAHRSAFFRPGLDQLVGDGEALGGEGSFQFAGDEGLGLGAGE